MICGRDTLGLQPRQLELVACLTLLAPTPARFVLVCRPRCPRLRAHSEHRTDGTGTPPALPKLPCKDATPGGKLDGAVGLARG